MSRLRRFVIPPERIAGDHVSFDASESRHMASVLRLAPGDLVIASDGRGYDYTVRLESLGATAAGTVLGVTRPHVESPLEITLVQGIPKGDKMEAIIRAATELGVRRIQPAITARTIVRLEPSRWRDRARRWQRVAKEAAKQCGRPLVPDVETPRPLSEWLGPPAVPTDLSLCLWEGEAPMLADVLRTAAPRRVRVLVGPEGGLAREEIEGAGTHGWQPATLGPRVLRTETAGPAIVAILQYTLGDLGRTPA